VPVAEIEAVLFDVDGVLRHWDTEPERLAEAAHGLPAGAIRGAAFDNPIEQRVLTGVTDFEGWVAETETHLVETHGPTALGAAQMFFEANTCTVDLDMLALVAELTATGVTVGLFSNGTDRFETEMSELGVEVDHLFNGHRLGAAKPDPVAFERVQSELGVAPSSIFFTDDKPANVEGARRAGWTAWGFSSGRSTRRDLADLGVMERSAPGS